MAYDNLKSYLQNEYNDYFRKEIERFEKVNSVEGQTVKVEEVNVKSVCCTESDIKHIGYFSYINMEIAVLAYVAFDGQSEEKKYTIHNIADLENSNTRLEFLENQIRIVESDLLEFHESSLYEEFMIPYIPPNKLEDIAEEFFKYFEAEYSKKAKIYKCYQFPDEEIVERLRIDMVMAELPESTMGRVYFKEDKLDVIYRLPFRKKCINQEDVVTPGTIVISSDSIFAQEKSFYGLVVPHEIIHWIYHRQFFKIFSLLDQDCVMLNCSALPQKFDERWSDKQKALWIAEWQANALGMRIAIPREQFESTLQLNYYAVIKARKDSYLARDMENVIRYAASKFIVSEEIAKQRAIQLGYDWAAGTLIEVDNEQYGPIFFPAGTLEYNQTFLIDKKGLEKVCAENKSLKAAIESGEKVYLGYVVCKNDEKYIEPVEDDKYESNEYKYKLTYYAQNHADECCEIFNLRTLLGEVDKMRLYGSCYLNKDFSAELETEYFYDENFKDKQSKEDLKKNVEKFISNFHKVQKILEEVSSQKTFGGLLKAHMTRKKISISQLSQRSLLSETTIKKYRNDIITPDIDNMMAIFIGMNLEKQYCEEMLSAAGRFLKKNNLKMSVYSKLIRDHSDGNIEQWNKILHEFGFPMIPDQRDKKKREEISKEVECL